MHREPAGWLAFGWDGTPLELDHLCGESSDRHIILACIGQQAITIEELDWSCERKWEPTERYYRELTAQLEQVVARLSWIHNSADEPLTPRIIQAIEQILLQRNLGK